MCGRWAMDLTRACLLRLELHTFFAARGRTSSEQEAKRAKQIRSEKREREKKGVCNVKFPFRVLNGPKTGWRGGSTRNFHGANVKRIGRRDAGGQKRQTTTSLDAVGYLAAGRANRRAGRGHCGFGRASRHGVSRFTASVRVRLDSRPPGALMLCCAVL